jgi:Uma2 family endonuclease
MAQAAERVLSAEEYLSWERRQPTKHEYVHGAVVAMAGASIDHNKIVANVIRALGNALADRPCSVLASDTRLYSPASGNYRYADASVACDPIQHQDSELDTLLNPAVIVEVLSESTEMADRGSKFRDYRSIPSFRDYLLVDQNEPLVEHYVRQDSGVWTYRDAGPNDRISLVSCAIEIQVSELYLKVFRPAAAG